VVAVHVGALLLPGATAVIADLDPALVELLVDTAHVLVVKLVLVDELVEPRQVHAALTLSLGYQRGEGFLELIAHDVLVP